MLKKPLAVAKISHGTADIEALLEKLYNHMAPGVTIGSCDKDP
jgi:hypothetical protein